MSAGSLPLGPTLVTRDALDPDDVRLQSRVNGELRQDSRTSDLIFDLASIVRDLSGYTVLEPGDVTPTGTTEGVALSGRFPYLKPGNLMELRIEGLGIQSQRVVTEGALQ